MRFAYVTTLSLIVAAGCSGDNALAINNAGDGGGTLTDATVAHPPDQTMKVVDLSVPPGNLDLSVPKIVDMTSSSPNDADGVACGAQTCAVGEQCCVQAGGGMVSAMCAASCPDGGISVMCDGPE